MTHIPESADSTDDAPPPPRRPDTYLHENFARGPEKVARGKRQRKKPVKGGQQNQMTIRALIVITAVVAVIMAAGIYAAIAIYLFIMFFFTFAILSTLFVRNDWYRNAVMALIASSRRRGLPISEGLRAFSGRSPAPDYGPRRLKKLADEIDAGAPLADAVTRYSRFLPRSTRALFRAIDYAGGSARALGRLNTVYNARLDAIAPIGNMIVYFLFVTMQMMVVSLFLYEFVWPRYQAILGDFGVSMPETSVVLSRVFDVQGSLGFAMRVYSGIMGLILIVYLSYLFRSGRGWGLVGALVPWVSTGERADIFRGLAETIRAGKPVEEVMKIFADWSMRRQVRRRCRLARQAMLKGQDWIDALRGEGLVRSVEVPLLKASVAAGHPADTLDQLADAIQDRQWYRWRLSVDVLQPALTIAAAVVVFLFVYSFYVPLVAMIEALA